MGRIMTKSRMILLYTLLILLDNILQVMNQILSHSHLTHIYLGLLFRQLLLTYFLTQLIQSPKVLLNKFLILLILQPLISRQSRMSIQVRIANLINNILTSRIQRSTQLIFDQIKIRINRLLQYSTLGFNTTIHGILLNKAQNVILIEEDSSPHMVMILLDTVLTTTSLLPHTALWRAEHSDLLTVLAFIHRWVFLLLNINYYHLNRNGCNGGLNLIITIFGWSGRWILRALSEWN